MRDWDLVGLVQTEAVGMVGRRDAQGNRSFI